MVWQFILTLALMFDGQIQGISNLVVPKGYDFQVDTLGEFKTLHISYVEAPGGPTGNLSRTFTWTVPNDMIIGKVRGSAFQMNGASTVSNPISCILTLGAPGGAVINPPPPTISGLPAGVAVPAGNYFWGFPVGGGVMDLLRCEAFVPKSTAAGGYTIGVQVLGTFAAGDTVSAEFDIYYKFLTN